MGEETLSREDGSADELNENFWENNGVKRQVMDSKNWTLRKGRSKITGSITVGVCP
jgi:hypothetical protein